MMLEFSTITSGLVQKTYSTWRKPNTVLKNYRQTPLPSPLL